MMLSLAACGNNSSSGSGTTPPPANNSSSADKSGGTTTPAPANNVTLKLGFSTNEEDPRALGAKQFKEEVESKTNGTVEFETEVNPDIIGGFILEYDTYRMDASVRNRLNTILTALR